MARVSNIELLDYFLEVAEEEGTIKPDDPITVNATVSHHLADSIETSYRNIFNALMGIAYRLEWANHFERNMESRPSFTTLGEDTLFVTNFLNPETATTDEVIQMNTRLHRGLLSSTFKDMLDLLGVYADFLHDVSFIIKHRECGVTRKQISDARRFLLKGRIADKLIVLDKDYGFPATYNDMLLSLFEARNRFTHSDAHFSPVPREKRLHEVHWLAHRIRIRRRNSSTWLDEKKVARFAKQGKMGGSKIKFKYFSERRTKRFLDDLGKPQLNEQDMREIVHFLFLILENFHKHLVKLAHDAGLQPRPFEEYQVKLHIDAAVEDVE